MTTRSPISPARDAALAVLSSMNDGRTDLGSALAHAKRGLADSRDRALAGELVLGVLRHRAALDYQIGLRVTRPMAKMDAAVLEILRLGVFQLLHLSRVPAAAIVNDAVSQVRRAGKSSAAGLVNAVLRRVSREREALQWPALPADDDPAAGDARVARLAVIHSHPTWLVRRWCERVGMDAAESWLAFNNRAPALMLAANRARTDRDALARLLAEEGVVTRPADHSPLGLEVVSGAALETAPFAEGLFVVQDEASQLVPQTIGRSDGCRVLDACAAPGGKTVALAAAAGAEGLVVACDVRPRRVRVLAETLSRAALPRAAVVHVSADGSWPFAPGTFDRILIDAPCSGLGTVRRDPDIKWRREPADLARFADDQTRLLASVAPLLAAEGRLVYSTCSSEPDENEAVIATFLASHPDFSVAPIAAGGDTSPSLVAMATADGFLRTLPHRDGLEAFFAAVLTRRPAV